MVLRPNRAQAEQQLKALVAEMEAQASRLAAWLEKNLPEGFTVFAFPKHHQRKLRTTNVVERLSRKLRRRARVVSILPNEAACRCSLFTQKKIDTIPTPRPKQPGNQVTRQPSNQYCQ